MPETVVVRTPETRVVVSRAAPSVVRVGDALPPPLAHEVGAANVFNARAFGAVGNGVADDRAAIQAALDAAGAAGGGTVYVPEGTFLLSYGVSVPSNVHLKGAGGGRTTLKFKGAVDFNDTILTAYLGYIVTMYNVTNASVSDMTLDGNRDNQDEFAASVVATELGSRPGCARIGGRAFTSERSTFCRVENVRAVNSVCDGIILTCATDCEVYRTYSANHGKGAQMSNAMDVSDYSVRCRLVECEGWGCVHGGLEIESGSGSTTDCTIERCRTDSLIINAASTSPAPRIRCALIDNYVDSRNATQRPAGSRHGIVFNSAVSDVVVRGNRVYSGDGYGMVLGASGMPLGGDRSNCSKNVEVADNQFSRNPSDAGSFTGIGLALTQVDDAVVKGNTISGTWNYGMYLMDCRGLVVSANTVVGRSATVGDYYAPEDDSREGAIPNLPGIGIELQRVEDSVISANAVRGYATGAIAEVQFAGTGGLYSVRNVVQANNLRHNWRSVYPVAGGNESAPQTAASSTWSNNKTRAP